jgi:hypothetical protein
MTATDRPWTALHPRIAEVLRPALPGVVETSLEEIAGQLPALGGDLGGEYGRLLRSGIEHALERLLALFGTSAAALDARLTELYESFGARESRHDRPLDLLLAAYRIGARVAWARFSQAAVEAGVEVAELVRLADSIFAYIDELSAASVTGHARDHAARTSYRDILRSRLVETLITGQAVGDTQRVKRLADEVAWVIPGLLAVAVLPTPDASRFTDTRLPMAPPDVLVLPQENEILAILPDPCGPGRRARFEAVLGPDAEVYVGTVRPAEEAPISLAHARAVQQLVRDGVLPRAPVLVAADHLADLVVHADARLLADLTKQELAPLSQLTPRRRDELARTLHCWLAHQGNRHAVAHQLSVHPHTVSYRMAQLEELFGEALHDPRRRLALAVALEVPGRW